MAYAYTPEVITADPDYQDEPIVEGAGEVVPFEQPVHPLLANLKSPNIAEDLDDSVLNAIGSKAIEEFDIDEASREAEGWTKRNEAALKLAMQVKEVKTYPWPNAANVKYPLIAVAAIQFNARAYPAIVDGANVVKGKVLGKPDEEKRARADRIAQHMSYQLIEEMDGWEEDTDRLLIMLPIVGTVFRKTYFNPGTGKNASELIGPDKLVVNYWAKPLDACPRVTQVCEYYPHEIEERFRDGRWRRITLGGAPSGDNDQSAPHTFLEQHRLWDLDEDGYPEPYIVTVHKETGHVVRIVARYDEKGLQLDAQGEVVSIRPVQYFTKYGFIPSMDGSFYDIGFGSLLDALNETINSTINQLMDAGHLANVQGGFIGSGVSLKAGAIRLGPGEWKRVEVSGQDLKSNIVPLPVKDPSSVLFQLLGMLIEASRDITATKDILTGETQGQNQPVGTTLATIEQGLKVFTAIYKRIHRSLKQELGLLQRLNRLYLDDEAYFAFHGVEGKIARADYESDDCDVLPVSDPSVVTDMQKVARAQYLGQFLQVPGMNVPKIIARMLEAASIGDIEELFGEPPGPDPQLLIEADRLKLEERKVALLEQDSERKDAGNMADIGAKQAQAQKTTVETALLAPELLPMVQAMVQQAVLQTLALAGAQNEPAGTVRPGDVSGMAGPPVDPAAAAVLPGPAGFAQGPMGPGGGDVPLPAGQGPADGGVVAADV